MASLIYCIVERPAIDLEKNPRAGESQGKAFLLLHYVFWDSVRCVVRIQIFLLREQSFLEIIAILISRGKIHKEYEYPRTIKCALRSRCSSEGGEG